MKSSNTDLKGPMFDLPKAFRKTAVHLDLRMTIGIDAQVPQSVDNVFVKAPEPSPSPVTSDRCTTTHYVGAEGIGPKFGGS